MTFLFLCICYLASADIPSVVTLEIQSTPQSIVQRKLAFAVANDVLVTTVADSISVGGEWLAIVGDRRIPLSIRAAVPADYVVFLSPNDARDRITTPLVLAEKVPETMPALQMSLFSDASILPITYFAPVFIEKNLLCWRANQTYQLLPGTPIIDEQRQVTGMVHSCEWNASIILPSHTISKALAGVVCMVSVGNLPQNVAPKKEKSGYRTVQIDGALCDPLGNIREVTVHIWERAVDAKTRMLTSYDGHGRRGDTKYQKVTCAVQAGQCLVPTPVSLPIQTPIEQCRMIEVEWKSAGKAQHIIGVRTSNGLAADIPFHPLEQGHTTTVAPVWTAVPEAAEVVLSGVALPPGIFHRFPADTSLTGLIFLLDGSLLGSLSSNMVIHLDAQDGHELLRREIPDIVALSLVSGRPAVWTKTGKNVGACTLLDPLTLESTWHCDGPALCGESLTWIGGSPDADCWCIAWGGQFGGTWIHSQDGKAVRIDRGTLRWRQDKGFMVCQEDVGLYPQMPLRRAAYAGDIWPLDPSHNRTEIPSPQVMTKDKKLVAVTSSEALIVDALGKQAWISMILEGQQTWTSFRIRDDLSIVAQTPGRLLGVRENRAYLLQTAHVAGKEGDEIRLLCCDAQTLRVLYQTAAQYDGSFPQQLYMAKIAWNSGTRTLAFIDSRKDLLVQFAIGDGP